MPAETFRLPLRFPRVQLSAIEYLALLAYPNLTERKNRRRFVDTAIAWLWKVHIEEGGSRKDILKKYSQWRPSRIHKNSKLQNGLSRIHRRRLVAAHMFNWLMFHEWGFKVTAYNQRATGVNTAALALVNWRGDTFRDSGVTSSHIKDRIWSETKPVLHLAVALKAFIDRNDYYVSSGHIHTLRLIRNASLWLESTIRSAESLRTLYLPFTLQNFDKSLTIQVLPQDD